MENVWLISAVWLGPALLASIISIRVAVSVALIEIMVGALAGNIIGLDLSDWVNFLAGFGAILAQRARQKRSPPPSALPAASRRRCTWSLEEVPRFPVTIDACIKIGDRFSVASHLPILLLFGPGHRVLEDADGGVVLATIALQAIGLALRASKC